MMVRSNRLAELKLRVIRNTKTDSLPKREKTGNTSGNQGLSEESSAQKCDYYLKGHARHRVGLSGKQHAAAP